MTKVVILGSGLTGLSAAYHFEQQGFFDFKIFEKNSSTGGLLRSFYQDGFTFDFTGHLLHISNPEFYQFIDNVAGINNFFVQERNSFIYTHNKFIPYPFQSNLYDLPKEVIFDCINGYVNRKKNIKNPKTFYEWVLKYFGSGIGKHFFFPYNSKLLAYNLKKITPSWTGRFVPKINFETILKSALNKNNNNNVGYNSSFYYPKKDGIQFLINNLEKKIKSKIYKNHKAINIDLKNKTIYFENGHTEKFDKLISTMPLDILLNSLNEKSNTKLKDASSKLLCNSVINFNLGFNTNNIKDKHWIYYPEKKHPFYRIGFWQNICKNSAPINSSAIYGETSYLAKNKTSEKTFNVKKQIEQITKNSINKAIEALELTNKNITIKKILHIPRAYVIYDLWREKHLKSLHKRLNSISIFSIGRYGEWKYSSMQEAFLDGKNITKTIIKTENIVPDKNTHLFYNPKKQTERAW